jgi:hypothetical protein
MVTFSNQTGGKLNCKSSKQVKAYYEQNKSEKMTIVHSLKKATNASEQQHVEFGKFL